LRETALGTTTQLCMGDWL